MKQIHFHFKNDRPIYIQLVEQLELHIITGRLEPGEKLPSVRDLAVQAQVNPNTMQRALQELEEKGLVTTERTNGKYITDHAHFIQKRRDKLIFQKIESFIRELSNLGVSRAEIITYLRKIKGKED